jgi:hypothetical protein
VLIHCDGDEHRLEAPEGLDGAEVRGGFDDDEIAGVEEGLGDQLERLDGPARDQQLVVCGSWNNVETLSRGNVSGSGNPPANEMSPGTPRNATPAGRLTRND